MLINILQKNGDLYDLSWKGDQILEIYHIDHKPADLLKLCVYDPASNTLEEIQPDIKKVAFMSSETTSGAGLYQPKTPKALIKSDKK